MSKQIVFGIHAITAVLDKHPDRILRLCVSNERQDKKIQDIIKRARHAHLAVETLSRAELDQLTQNANHQGVLAFCLQSKTYAESDLTAFIAELSEPPFLLILDGVQDPHNLGACFRSAEAAGVHAIIVPKDKSVGITPVVSKVASGAAESIPFFQVTNLARTIEQLKEQQIWVYGAAAEASRTLYQTDLKGPLALVLGAEGSGMRRLTREMCDGLANIPMRGSVSSLNVSVATGIFLFEALRQRLAK